MEHAQGLGLLHNGNGGDEGEVVGGSTGVGEPHLGVDISHVAQAVHAMAVQPVTTDKQTPGRSMSLWTLSNRIVHPPRVPAINQPPKARKSPLAVNAWHRAALARDRCRQLVEAISVNV